MPGNIWVDSTVMENDAAAAEPVPADARTPAKIATTTEQTVATPETIMLFRK